jgi:hypothetical protein
MSTTTTAIRHFPRDCPLYFYGISCLSGDDNLLLLLFDRLAASTDRLTDCMCVEGACSALWTYVTLRYVTLRYATIAALTLRPLVLVINCLKTCIVFPKPEWHELLCSDFFVHASLKTDWAAVSSNQKQQSEATTAGVGSGTLPFQNFMHPNLECYRPYRYCHSAPPSITNHHDTESGYASCTGRRGIVAQGRDTGWFGRSPRVGHKGSVGHSESRFQANVFWQFPRSQQRPGSHGLSRSGPAGGGQVLLHRRVGFGFVGHRRGRQHDGHRSRGYGPSARRSQLLYLELFDLHKTLSNELGESILADPGDLGCVCAVLQEMMARGGTDGPMWAIISDLVEAHPDACFLPKETTHNQGVMACSLPLLEKLWESTKMDAFVAVKALQKWNKEHEASEETQAPLQKLADKIRLETISAANLAEIKPCALFSMERLYEAFVHHGKSLLPASMNSSPLLSAWNSFSKISSSATVRGAGVECANGSYTWMGGLSSKEGYYQMVGNYGDLPCWYRLKKTEPTGWNLVVATGQVNAQELVLYESSAGTVSKPAFALWNCVDGKDPTPYVSVQGRGNTFGGFFNNNNNNNNPLPESNIDQVADAFRAQTNVRNTNTQARRRVRVCPYG